MTPRLAALLVALALVVVWSHRALDERLGPRSDEAMLYLWSGDHVATVFPGFESLAADVYWLRTVQYFGGQKLFSQEKDFALLRPLIEITTTLDPRLEIAYRYGAVFLSEQPPGGAGRPKEGIEILEKGVGNLPESWRLRQDLGFFHFLYLQDAGKAAAILDEASELPGAAFWLKTLAADLLSKGGERAASRTMWQKMYEQAEEGILRENAEFQLSVLDSLDLADQLTSLVAEIEERTGRRPATLEELQQMGLWRGPVTDLSGSRFSYDEKTGQVSIALESPLWRPS